MSNKITDARIAELQQLKDLKDELSDKIQKQKDEMQNILDSMDDEAQNSHRHLQKQQRLLEVEGRLVSTIRTQSMLELAIDRLEEDYSRLETELEALEEAMNST